MALYAWRSNQFGPNKDCDHLVNLQWFQEAFGRAAFSIPPESGHPPALHPRIQSPRVPRPVGPSSSPSTSLPESLPHVPIPKEPRVLRPVATASAITHSKHTIVVPAVRTCSNETPTCDRPPPPKLFLDPESTSARWRKGTRQDDAHGQGRGNESVRAATARSTTAIRFHPPPATSRLSVDRTVTVAPPRH